MNTEDKFMAALSRANEPCVMYLKSAGEYGYIKLEYRKTWDDGLGNRSQVRVINTRLGISTAPASWIHLIKSLGVNDVSEEELGRVLDRRIELQVLHHYQTLSDMKKVFGDIYVDDLIETKGKRSFADDIKDLYNSLIKRNPPKPTLTIVKGVPDE